MLVGEETRRKIFDLIERSLGISYDDFDKLDIDEQNKLIEEYWAKNRKMNRKKDEDIVMIGSGDSTMFIKVKKGKKVMIGSGRDSCFVRVGSRKGERCELRNGDKSVRFMKKLKRVLRK